VKQATLRISRIYNKNPPQTNTVLKTYRALFLHSIYISIKHKAMIMKRRKKKRSGGTEKMSTLLVKRRKPDNWFGECFLTRRILRNRHLLESSNNRLNFSPYTRRSYLPKQSKPMFFTMPSDMLRTILSIVLVPTTRVQKPAIV